jgi:hypothetical protein
VIPVSTPGEDLALVFADRPLVGAWFTGEGDGPAAGAELEACLAAAPAGEAAPWFTAPAAAAWARELADDLADEADRTLLRENLAALAAGRADVVVTGQQPGFLGGPLYTLYKVATAVALARRRTAAGQPTVPVFWSGDDDDDLREAVAAVAWLPGGGGFVRSESVGQARRERAGRRMLGRLPVTDGQANGVAWLARIGDVDADGAAAAGLWAEAAADGWTWSRLQRRALLRAFAGTGLLIVSGDDSRLHATAAPLYARIGAVGDELAAAAAARGRELQSAGWHAQLAAASLARPLFVDRDGRRVAAGDPVGAAPGQLRPGVMLRSPVQDWLLRPAAVVVGPGEYAYLRQLTGVYARLGVARCALVPRLFAWLLPPDFDRTLLARRRQPPVCDPVGAAAVLDRWQEDAARRLRQVLTAGLHLPAQRGEALTRGRLRRWRRGLDAAVRSELEAQRRAAVPTEPAWVFPEGERQERRLAWVAALAVWGPELTAAALVAADKHLEAGRNGDWREWEITVKNPELGHD